MCHVRSSHSVLEIKELQAMLKADDMTEEDVAYVKKTIALFKSNRNKDKVQKTLVVGTCWLQEERLTLQDQLVSPRPYR